MEWVTHPSPLMAAIIYEIPNEKRRCNSSLSASPAGYYDIAT